MTRVLFILVGILLAPLTQAAAGPIRHLEPLHWWVGMNNPQLQLMVHGEQIGDLTPVLAYPGVKLVSVERTSNRNYLFLNLVVGRSTRPGAFDIVFKRGRETVAQARYELHARRAGAAARQGFGPKDAVYLISPDRFANGDPSNDSLPGMLDKTDRSLPLARHGGDLAGMTAQLDYVQQLGFTMIWPTPLLENKQPEYSYHGYALTDYYRIDPRFGSNADYQRYVAEANKRGIGVIHDVVLNHIGTGHWWMKDLPAPDWLNYQHGFVATNNQHSTVQDIHAAPQERQRFLDGWFVDSMPDLNQRNALLARYLIQNSIWWVEYANLSGIREDTFSYADPAFLAAWCKAILDEYPNFNIVGEEMDRRPHKVAYWQKGARNRDGYDAGLPSLMDFPVADTLSDALTAKESDSAGFIELYETLAADYLYADPMQLMVFPDNHDRSRILARLHGNVDLLKTALLFTATVRGIPQMYYGTEVLMTSPFERDDGLLRGDMPGGWTGDTANAFSGAGLTPAQGELQAFVRKLFNWRKSSQAVATGKLVHFLPQQGRYVYFRQDSKQTVMVVLNKNPTSAPLDLSRFQSVIGAAGQGRDIISGEAVSLRTPLALKSMTSVAIAW